MTVELDHLLQAGRAKLAAKRKAEDAAAERKLVDETLARQAKWNKVKLAVCNDLGPLSVYANLTLPGEDHNTDDALPQTGFNTNTDRVTIAINVLGCVPIYGCWSRFRDGRPWSQSQHHLRGVGDVGLWRIDRYHCWSDSENDYFVGTASGNESHYTDDLDVALAIAEEEELRKPIVEAEVAKRNADREVANQRREQRRTERENAKTTGEKLLDLLTDLIDERIPQTEDA